MTSQYSVPRPAVTDGPDCDKSNDGKSQLETFLARLLLKHLGESK